MAACTVPEFSKSPLDNYRRNASFEWEKLKNILYSTEEVQFQNQFYDEIRKHPTLSTTLSLPENEKRISTKEVFDINDIRRNLSNRTLPKISLINSVNPSVSIKHGLNFNLFTQTMSGLGTERHQRYKEMNSSAKIIGTFALTEIAHGSNTKRMETTAFYDKNAKEFILNTPNFFAAKCWISNGKVATHIVLYAQLITTDNINHGLHAFVVEIRNPLTLLPYPGIIITDLGEKNGLESLDNGLIMFNNYRIPKDNLLNRLADVSDDGTYIPHVTDPTIRLGILLSSISSGRVRMLGFATVFIRDAVAIAVRYAATTKNKVLNRGDELPSLESPSHQIRLIPCIAITYIGHIMHNDMQSIQNRLINSMDSQSGAEFHALTSAAKPAFTLLMRDGLRKCWEVCTGNGYLKVSGLEGIIRSSDPICTYEGDNHVLIQQTTNWLMKLWPRMLEGKTIINFPLESVNFMSSAREILTQSFAGRCVADFIDPQNILKCYQWLTCYLLKVTYEKQTSLQRGGTNTFSTRNNSQVYFSKSLATVYILHFFIQRTYKIISDVPDGASKEALLKLLSLFGVWNLQKYTQYFYQGNYASGPEFVQFLEDAILKLCKNLKDDAISLMDAIVPADFLIHSVLGRSDGNVYERLESVTTHTHGTFAKVAWRDEINEWRRYPSKL
ncbi:hypothetical protein RI129_006488 [Pyrocoelia pectoralis]|uniref:Acyl-coenzyme A oxidase n=1 Tax=Pyrocoelia pectoralis TaxID=417401 RepID=A0AAN7ZNU9_9COLE